MNPLRRLTLAALLAAGPAAALDRRISYPAQDLGNRANRYPLRLLEAALAPYSSQYKLEPVARMQQGRALAQVGAGQGLDIIWSATSIERESQLLPVRIPIYKGLIGWRLLLIRRDDAGRFRNLAPAQLKSLRCVSGHDWPDTEVLADGGMQVRRASSSNGNEAMFRLLEDGHIDFFPRSALEIWDEAAAHPGLMVEPSLAIHYPLATYFFVNRQMERLAGDLERGLNQLHKNGSFDKIFQEFFGDVLKQAHLKERRILELPNPRLPPLTPLARRELWL